jgi:hypothetical protein
MAFRMSDTTKLDRVTTAKTDKAITMVGFIWVVTAKAEHIPRTCMVTGLLSDKGSVISFLSFLPRRGFFSMGL